MNRSSEIWRPIAGYEGLYEISSFGNIRSPEKRDAAGKLRKAKVLRPAPVNKYGHQSLRLVKDGQKTRVYIHTIVLETFVGPRPIGMDACHNDGNALNNSVANLRWGTRSENIRDSIRHGQWDYKFGSRNGNARLSDDEIPRIRDMLRTGVPMPQIGEHFGVSKTAIRNIAIGHTWTHI